MTSLRTRPAHNLVLFALVLTACSAFPLQRDDTTQRASPTSGYYAGSCHLNQPIRINEGMPGYSFIGGNLAANVNAASYPVRSVDKSIWALRTAHPPAELLLIRERLDAPAPAVEFVGKPIEHGDDSALPEWGPTYYVEIRFPSAGCWRFRLRDGQPEDFIVFHVIERSA